MLRGGNPLTVGVGIIIEVIRKNNSDYDLENQIGPVPKNSDPIYLGTLLRQFAEHIPHFMELVHNPNHTVVNQDGSTATRKRELKTAFGEKIEPLGFDRFKTCELMAELLHCSNMALLNERGSEAEVKRRDAERERLKAEGKLTSRNDSNSGDFSTSVDSHGFHHARAPSSEAPELVKRLEVQNNSEDDFEKIAKSETAVDEAKDNEEAKQSPPSSTQKASSPAKITDKDGEFVDEPLSPVKETSSEAATPTKGADDAESPTSAGLSSQVGGLDLDNDTVMGDRQEPAPTTTAEPSSKEAPSLLTQQLNKETQDSSDTISPHPEDTPAPLFAGKRSADNNNDEKPAKSPKSDVSRFTATVAESEGSEVTPIDETSSARSVLLGGTESQYAPQYEVDIDGTPVVGDLLKMKFVENKVVPTILVSLPTII
jgi:SIT4-associating protein SAP185/190